MSKRAIGSLLCAMAIAAFAVLACPRPLRPGCFPLLPGPAGGRTRDNGASVAKPEGVGTIRIGGEGGLIDAEGLVAKRYDAEPGAAYLLQPDGYVAARFRHPTRDVLDAALSRASGLN